MLVQSQIKRLRAPDLSEQSIYDTIACIAESKGPLVPGRSGLLIEKVIPKSHEDSPTNSPSRVVGFDSIAFHLDGSHYATPPRFLVFGCLSNDGENPTLLIDTGKWNFDQAESRLLKSAVFFINSGRKSFYGSIFGVDGKLCRFDPYCMTPTGLDSERALELMNQRIEASEIESVHWQRGDIVVLDNRRILHARGPVNPGAKRVLLRGAMR